MSLFCNFALSTYSLYFGYQYPVSCTQYINHMPPRSNLAESTVLSFDVICGATIYNRGNAGFFFPPPNTGSI